MLLSMHGSIMKLRTGLFSHVLEHIMKTEQRGIITRRLLMLKLSVMLLFRVG